MAIDFDRTIGLNPHFSSHVVDDRQVLLLSEQRSFRLTGKLHVAMLPHLDGTRTGEQIVAAFKGRVAEEQLRTALRNMFEKDYLGYIEPQAPRSRQACWSEWGISPATAERNLAQRSIAVTAASRDGAAAEAANMLRQAAKGAGLRVVTQKHADLVVVSVADYLQRDLEATNRRMRAANRSWMPFKAGGNMPLFGPLFRADAAPCWSCLTNRMMENRPGDRLVDGKIKAVRPALAYNRATIGLAASFAALELARALAEDDRSRLERHVISFDLKSHSYREHMVRQDPNCPVCGVPYDQEKALERGKAPVVLQARSVLADNDGGWRSLSADEVVRRLGRYVSPITGLIADLDDCSPDDGLPVFQARQTNPVHTSPRANRLVGRPSGAAGKGMGRAQAQASCLAEAAERYLCGYTGSEPRMRAPWAAVKDSAPHPYSYLNYSEPQYDTRETWNKRHDGFNWVGERFDESREIEWTPAWSLTRNQLRWLPTRYCYYNYADPSIQKEADDNAFCIADSNGCASGSVVEEAILQGFFELVERDACALWWYNRVRRPAFDLDAIDNPFVRRVRAYCKRLERGLHVLDLTNDLGIPVAIALSYRQADGKSIVLGLGAHLDAEVAVNRALAEMNQMITLEVEVAKLKDDDKKAGHGDEAVMLDWMKNKSLQTEPYCVFDGKTDVGAYQRPRIQDLNDAVKHCMRVVSDRGFEMIVLDQSRPEIDFAAARVVVPGMRHFWARFREGRLYRAPVDMGWLGKPLDESELNPIPFFL